MSYVARSPEKNPWSHLALRPEALRGQDTPEEWGELGLGRKPQQDDPTGSATYSEPRHRAKGTCHLQCT